MTTPTPAAAPKARTASVTFIFLTVVLDVLGFGLLIPVAPKLVQGLLNAGQGGTEAQAAEYFGVLTSIYAAMVFMCAPTLGALSDRFGRRTVLLTALLGSGLDYFAMALSPTIWILFLTRAINGMTGASLTVCNAYIADVTPRDKRAAAYGMIGAAFGLGFVLGPLMGGVLAASEIRLPLGITYHGDIHYPFYAAGALTMLNWAYGMFVLPESLPPERRAHFRIERANPVRVFAGVGKYPLVGGLTAGVFIMNLAMFGLHATWVLYTGHRYKWDELHVGLSLALVGVMAAVIQGGLARKIIPALGPGMVGEKRALILGGFIGVMSYLGYGLATEGWMIYATIFVGSLGGIAQPAFQAIVTKTVRPDEQGAIQGAITGSQSIAQIFGPLIATNVFAWFVSDSPPIRGLQGASFLLGAVLALLGTFVAMWSLRRFLHHPEGEPSEPAAGPPPSPVVAIQTGSEPEAEAEPEPEPV